MPPIASACRQSCRPRHRFEEFIESSDRRRSSPRRTPPRNSGCSDMPLACRRSSCRWIVHALVTRPIRPHAGEPRIDEPLYLAVRRTGSRQGCTLFVTLLAAFDVLLARLSGSKSWSSACRWPARLCWTTGHRSPTGSTRSRCVATSRWQTRSTTTSRWPRGISRRANAPTAHVRKPRRQAEDPARPCAHAAGQSDLQHRQTRCPVRFRRIGTGVGRHAQGLPQFRAVHQRHRQRQRSAPRVRLQRRLVFAVDGEALAASLPRAAGRGGRGPDDSRRRIAAAECNRAHGAHDRRSRPLQLRARCGAARTAGASGRAHARGDCAGGLWRGRRANRAELRGAQPARQRGRPRAA